MEATFLSWLPKANMSSKELSVVIPTPQTLALHFVSFLVRLMF